MDPLPAYPPTNPQKRSPGGGLLKVAETGALHADGSSDAETASSATFTTARGRERGVARGSGWGPKPPCWPYRGQRWTLPKSLCPPLAHARSATSPRRAAPSTSGGLLLVVLPHGCAARRLPRLKQVRLGAYWSGGGACCQTGAQTAQKTPPGQRARTRLPWPQAGDHPCGTSDCIYMLIAVVGSCLDGPGHCCGPWVRVWSVWACVGGPPLPPHKGAVPASARPASIMHPLLRATC